MRWIVFLGLFLCGCVQKPTTEPHLEYRDLGYTRAGFISVLDSTLYTGAVKQLDSTGLAMFRFTLDSGAYQNDLEFLQAYSDTTAFDKIQSRLDIFYKVNDSLPYTGWILAYHPNGQIAYRAAIINGIEFGPVTTWFENGFVSSRAFAFKKKYIGIKEKFDMTSGSLVERCEVPLGIKDGLTETFYVDGSKKTSTHYLNGKKHGDCREYFTDGTVKHKSSWANGLLVGKSVTFRSPGFLGEEDKYSNSGKLESRKIYGDEGYVTQYEYVPTDSGEIKYTTMWTSPENVLLRRALVNNWVIRFSDDVDSFYVTEKWQVNSSGEKHGQYFQYDEHGTVRQVRNYLFDKIWGYWEWYDENGQLINREYHSGT